jgi:hypothetical protein
MEREVGMTQSTDLGMGIDRSMADPVVQNIYKGPATVDTNLG